MVVDRFGMDWFKSSGGLETLVLVVVVVVATGCWANKLHSHLTSHSPHQEYEKGVLRMYQTDTLCASICRNLELRNSLESI